MLQVYGRHEGGYPFFVFYFSASLLMVFSAVVPSMDFSPMKSEMGTFETDLQVGK